MKRPVPLRVPLFLIILLAVQSCSGNNPQHVSKTDSAGLWITSIELKTGEIQREGIPFTLLASPAGTCHWKVFKSDNDSLVASFDQDSPSLTLPAGAYDVLVTITGANTLTRHFRRGITVLPPVFREEDADEVIDFSPPYDTGSVVKEYKSIVRPGYKILVKGSLKGRLKISGLRGTRKNPVHIINQGQVVIEGWKNRYYPWTWDGNNQYILVDGKADPNIPYGFKVVGNPVKGSQTFMIGGEFNKGFELVGMNVVGQYAKTTGAAAIQVQTSYTPACNATNWSFEYFKAHHCKIQRANTEGFYIGYSTDSPRESGFSAYPMGQVLVYRDTIVDSGWDALQISSADEFEVHDNYIRGSALADQKNQNNFFSWNDGNLKGYCYRNSFYDCKHGVGIGFGIRGQQAYLYNNLFVQKKLAAPDSSRFPGFFYVKLHNQHQRVGLYIFNNTVITNLLPAKISYKNIHPNEGIPLVFAGNALVMRIKNPKNFPEITIEKFFKADSASRIITNRWSMQDQQSSLKMTDTYHPASLTSPLLEPSFDVEKTFPGLKGGYYDHDGYPLRNAGKDYTFGCYSGYELFNQPPEAYGTDKRN